MSDSASARVEQYVVDLFRPQDYNGHKYGVFKIGWFQTCRSDKPADNRLYWSVPTRTREYDKYVDADSYVETRAMLQLDKCLKMPDLGCVVAFVRVSPSSKPHPFASPGSDRALYFNDDGECFVFGSDVPAVDNPAHPGVMRVYITE